MSKPHAHAPENPERIAEYQRRYISILAGHGYMPTEARTAFLKLMEGKEYGEGPLLSAWSWFIEGYAPSHEQQNAAPAGEIARKQDGVLAHRSMPPAGAAPSTTPRTRELDYLIRRTLESLAQGHKAVTAGTGHDPEKYSSTYSEAAHLIRRLDQELDTALSARLIYLANAND